MDPDAERERGMLGERYRRLRQGGLLPAGLVDLVEDGKATPEEASIATTTASALTCSLTISYVSCEMRMEPGSARRSSSATRERIGQ